MAAACSETDWRLPWDGGCRCGQVRIRISAPPLLTSACHCTGCQTMSASAFSLSVSVPEDGFAVVAGEPVVGGLHGEVRHFFCGHCKTWMFTRPPPGAAFINVRPSILDWHGWFVPFAEFWLSEKLPWAVTPAVHGFEGFPPMEQFPELIEQFAARGVCRPG
ncbi:aldehyde-activating protein [Rhizorhabdus dicambivorans]|uniref:Aldehyde-activating protein n=3 Tax=Rhizorhabdus dicambivorans TaxID=1850238 RepID=A0A2A4FTD9_9SPHN|nr:GFA family protein [Rhizorhabdus dicambivorans]ATE67210.1 aldehyde-activating protein [Rhizorhabdus dicambivorans]PCE40952.1 aldehyde-activating protein [Rhizorhabdus dicambivorans]